MVELTTISVPRNEGELFKELARQLNKGKYGSLRIEATKAIEKHIEVMKEEIKHR